MIEELQNARALTLVETITDEGVTLPLHSEGVVVDLDAEGFYTIEFNLDGELVTAKYRMGTVDVDSPHDPIMPDIGITIGQLGNRSTTVLPKRSPVVVIDPNYVEPLPPQPGNHNNVG